jgi:hypothetical protein
VGERVIVLRKALYLQKDEKQHLLLPPWPAYRLRCTQAYTHSCTHPAVGHPLCNTLSLALIFLLSSPSTPLSHSHYRGNCKAERFYLAAEGKWLGKKSEDSTFAYGGFSLAYFLYFHFLHLRLKE